MPNPFWEREYLDNLIPLLDVPDLPPDLRREIMLASKEFSERSEITYPTIARIKYYAHQHSAFFDDLKRRNPPYNPPFKM